mmetsp:Transcript_10037/g.31484  ORF Transcript_10037/g.31484 Transcript_10037/m.31484 type:complete len:168 (+) Transcript_10037:1714-2217(+)
MRMVLSLDVLQRSGSLSSAPEDEEEEAREDGGRRLSCTEDRLQQPQCEQHWGAHRLLPHLRLDRMLDGGEGATDSEFASTQQNCRTQSLCGSRLTPSLTALTKRVIPSGLRRLPSLCSKETSHMLPCMSPINMALGNSEVDSSSPTRVRGRKAAANHLLSKSGFSQS